MASANSWVGGGGLQATKRASAIPRTTPRIVQTLTAPAALVDVCALTFDEAFERLHTRGVTQTLKRLRLDLSNALTRHLEILANFFERVILVGTDAIPNS